LYNLKKIPFKDWYKFLIVGCLGNLFPAFLFSLAGTKLDSAISGALNSTTPLFTLVIGGLFFKNRISKRQFYGILLGFLGALMLVLAGKEKSPSTYMRYWLFWQLFCMASTYSLPKNILPISVLTLW
jgi:drug/metabolite transporter (DMT)-like permease